MTLDAVDDDFKVSYLTTRFCLVSHGISFIKTRHAETAGTVATATVATTVAA